MKKIIYFSLFSILLSACNSEEIKTIEYYSQHIDEAKVLVEDCEKKTATKSENCKNAREAIIKDSFQKSLYGDGIRY